MNRLHPTLLAACLATAFIPLPATAHGVGQSSWSLGAVVDVRPGGDGGRVMAITPGGAAERLGLREGDRVLSVNGRAIGGEGDASALEGALQASDGRLRIEAVRNGEPLVLSGAADPGAAADGAGCGYVATSGGTPRLSENVYPVRVFDIDGNGTPLASGSHELAAGTHVLLVEELVDRHRLDPWQRDRRDRMRERLGPRAAKALVVEVAADTRYRIGARLLPGRLDSRGIGSNGFWEPVVWETEPARCTR